MDWIDQSTQLMNSWLEGQQKLWLGWLNQTSDTMPSFDSWQETAGQTMATWQTFWQEAAQPWLSIWQQSPVEWPGFNPFNLTSNPFQQAVDQWLETPALGITRETEEKFRRATKLWQEVVQASLDYQSVMGEGWSMAMQQMQTAVINRGQDGKPIDSLTDLTNLWSKVADPAFTKFFHSEKFIRTQGKLNTAVMKYRIQQRELVEQFSQYFDIPTRTEVDAAHKANYEQRKEIKALKKEISNLQSQLAELQETVATLNKPTAKRPAKKKTADTTPPAQEA